MDTRERLDRVSQILRRLEEERFIEALDSLHEAYSILSSSLDRIEEERSKDHGDQEAPEGMDQFLDEVQKINKSLQELRPEVLSGLLEEMLHSLWLLGDDPTPDSVARTLQHIETKLQELEPDQVVSRLADLTQVVYGVRPPEGFQASSYHPNLVARLRHLLVLPVLGSLEEVLHLSYSQATFVHLHLLQHFLHSPKWAPAA